MFAMNWQIGKNCQ